MKAVLYVLLPALARFDGLAGFRRRLAHADTLAPGRRDELAAADCFHWPGDTLPVAAFVREHVAHDAGRNVWICADLAHVEPDLTGARMLACGSLDIDADEAEALAQPLRPVLGDRGMILETTLPGRWHLRLPAQAPVPHMDPPGAVLGDDLVGHLPSGDPGRRWRHVLNEAQMILHQSPVNQARARQGRPTANSLWLWGAGILPVSVRTDVRQVFGDDVLLAAMAARAGLAVHPLAEFRAGQPVAAGTLLDFGQRDAGTGARIVLDLLDAGRVHALLLHFASGERYRLRRAHRWRFWRHGP